MPEEKFNYEEFAKSMYEQSLALMPDDIGVGDKEYLATTIKQFSQMTGEALNNEHSEYSSDIKVFFTQIVAEWTYQKGIDIIRAKIPNDLRDSLLQKVAFVVYQTVENGIKKGTAQENLIRNVENAVKKDFNKTIEEAYMKKLITEDIVQKLSDLSNDDSLMSRMKKQDINQERNEQYESDDEVFDFMREDLEKHYSNNDEKAATVQEKEQMYEYQKKYWTNQIENEPDNPEGYINMSKLEINNNPNKALEYINKAIELDESNITSYAIRAYIYQASAESMQSVDYQSCEEFQAKYFELCEFAIADFNRAFDTIEYKEEIAYQRGLAKLSLFDEQGAYDDFKLSIEINPNFIAPYYELSKMEIKRENYSNAIEYLDKAVEIVPDTGELYLLRGEAKEKGGNYEGAKADYKKALDLNPQDETAQYQLNWIEDCIARDEEFNREYEKLTKYINENPSDPEGYFNRGYLQTCYNVDDNIVLSDYDKAIELNPNYIRAIKYRIYLYEHMGDYENVIKDCLKLIELEPTWENYDLYIRYLKDGMNDFEKALECCNKTFELFEPNENMYESRGGVHYKLKNYDNAIEDYKKALEILIKDATPEAMRMNEFIIDNYRITIKEIEQAKVENI